jgi:hypothetical protein
VTRVLAAIAAIAMVAGALLVRERLDGGAFAGPGGSSDQVTSVLCDAALGAVCDDLGTDVGVEVRVEPAGVSLDRLSGLADAALQDRGSEGVPDAWVAIAPWPAMVEEGRARSGLQPLFDGAPPTVASSPLVLVVWTDRSEALLPGCGLPALSWSCITPIAGRPWAEVGGQELWGRVKPGLDDPGMSAVGLSALAQAAAEELGTTEFGSRSLRDGPFLDWLTRLGEAVPDYRPPAGSVLEAMVQVGPASYDLAATTEAAAGAVLATSARAADLRAHYPEPLMTADVVVAAPASVDSGALSRTVAAALAARGWHTADAAPEVLGEAVADTATLPTSPPGSTLPSAGAMTALRTTFNTVVRR